MGKTLVIAEKPSVARDLARVLGKVKKEKDWYEGDEYVVAAAVGHVVELHMPEDIDPKLKFWRLESLPIVPQKFELKPIERNEETFKTLQKLLKRKDVESVINACDAGREGELIFTYLYEAAKCKLPAKRLWLQSMTPESIRRAFEELRDDAEMIPLKEAARSRSEADWLIGINGTRALTTRMYGRRSSGKVATVGRVQTPTLTLVVERERQIRAFEPRPYWRLHATFGLAEGEYEALFQKPDFKRGEDEHNRADRLWEESEAKALQEAVEAALAAGTPCPVSEEKKRTRQSAPRLYDLTTLQREANGRYGFPAGKTLRVAQSLYEKHKLLTYPRTDSKALPEDYVETVKTTLGALEGDLGEAAKPVLKNGWVKPNKRIFNNAQVSDHFAIIPTGEPMKKLNEDEAKLFDLVSRRFIAIFYPPAEFDVTTRLTLVPTEKEVLGAREHTFKTEGKVLVEPGYLAVYGKSFTHKETIAAISEKDGSPAMAKLASTELEADETKPPPRYTEATLLSAMEGAGKLVEDEELAEAMKEKGLGTPATRASIIDHLVREVYMEREGRELVPTGKAEILVDFLRTIEVNTLTSPSLTGDWEYRLRQVEHGELSRAEFMKGIVGMTGELVERTKNYDGIEGKPVDFRSFTDNEPLVETLRFYRSQDGVLNIPKVVGNRILAEEEVRELVEKQQIGPLDGFLSKRGKRFSAVLKLTEKIEQPKKSDPDQEPKTRWGVEFDFGGDDGEGEDGEKPDLSQYPVIGTFPEDGSNVYATPQWYVSENYYADGDKKTDFRIARRLLGKEIVEEEFKKLLTEGKTGLIEGFKSKRTGRFFKAHLTLQKGGKLGFEFPPRAAKKASKKAAKKAAEKES